MPLPPTIRRLVGVCCLAALGAGGASAQQVRIRILVQSSPLAGAQYHELDAVWPQLREGDPLELAREPDNRHDANAVQVRWQGHLLGYLPRRENRAVATAIDRGRALSARIIRLQENADPWQRVKVQVLAAP
jgi:hypothetical protein